MSIQPGHIAILGAGESGVGTAILALKMGWTVFVSDRGEIKQDFRDKLNEIDVEWEEGKHNEERILSVDLVVKSPGIPDKAPLIVALKSKGVKIISEIEFAGYYCKAKTICITGSNGKTTTTLWVHHILRKAGFNVGLAGNIGQSFAKQVAENDFDYYVLEISSFQLDDMFDFRADIAILTNITPDHLDRYNYEMQNYVDSKFRILQNQTSDNWFIYNQDDPIISTEIAKRNVSMKLVPFSIKEEVAYGGYATNEQIIININKQFNMSIHELALKGKHNTQNALAASLASRILEIRKDVVRESLQDFTNVEHRLEFVAKVNGIEFINDSKATNVNSTWYALESMEKPIVWICGGQDKGNDYNELFDLVKGKVKAIVCLGKDNSKIIAAFKDAVDIIVETDNANDAVAASYKIGKKGDVVLLSPACASFDLFQNYEDRGMQFKRAVKGL